MSASLAELALIEVKPVGQRIASRGLPVGMYSPFPPHTGKDSNPAIY
jgi:hypothetical protein